MAHQAGGQRSVPRAVPQGHDAQAYLQDYAALLEAVPFPSFVMDHRWDVVLANSAFGTLFRGVGAHPTAMPDDNFLRFVLFHPDAATVLGDHESSWCLPMLAEFKAALEHSGHDHALQAIRREIGLDPLMDAAYRQGLAHWIRAVGEAAVEHDGAVRPLLHPDPRRGATECRLVVETPKTLRDMGYTRLTLVLRDTRRGQAGGRRPSRRRGQAGGRRPSRRRGAHHLTVVPDPGGDARPVQEA